MTIDKQEIKVLADHVKTDRRFCADDYHHALAEGVLALLAEISRIEIDSAYVAAGSRTRAEAIDQLKAENEALRKDAERYRWLRRGENYAHQYLVDLGMENLEGFDRSIDAAMAKEASHD